MPWWWWTELALAFDVERGTDGRPVTWPDFPVSAGWIADDTLSDGADTVAASVRTWSTVPGADITVASGGACVVPVISPFDGVNCVWVVDDWPYDPELLALASTWWDTRGDILGFDIEVNGARPWAPSDPDGFDLEATLTHEVGHGLGLEHSVDPTATMYATLLPSDLSARVLAPDDVAGARFLYPGGPGRGCAHGPPSAGALLPMLLLAFRRSAASRRSTGQSAPSSVCSRSRSSSARWVLFANTRSTKVSGSSPCSSA